MKRLLSAGIREGTGTVTMLPAWSGAAESVIEVTPDGGGEYEISIEYDPAVRAAGAEEGHVIPDVLTVSGETDGTAKISDREDGILVENVDAITLKWESDGEVTETTWTGLAETQSTENPGSGSSKTLIEVTESNGKPEFSAKTDSDGDGSFDQVIYSEDQKKPASDLKISLAKTSYVYDGKVKTPKVTVKDGQETVDASQYTVTYSSGRKKVGTYKVTLEFSGKYSGSREISFKITKAANPLRVKVRAASFSLSHTKLKKKAQTLTKKKLFSITKAQGKVTYKLVSVRKTKYKKYFKVNATTGTITVKKGLAKGTYTVKVKISAGGNSNYKSGSKTETVKIKVK